MGDAWNGVYTNLTTHSLEILDSNDNVVTSFDNTGSLNMTVTGTNGDYGTIGTDSNF